MREVPWAAADYWQRQARDARRDRNFWRQMTWYAWIVWSTTTLREHFHLYPWQAVMIVFGWMAVQLAWILLVARAERRRDEWTRKYLL